MSRIKVVDSYPGSGKTTFAINHMNKNYGDSRYLFITPFLDETERIKESCPNLNFQTPSVQKGKGRKLTHLLELLQEGHNICSTHALFSHMTDEIVEILRIRDYTLILDEVFQVIKNFDMWSDVGQGHTGHSKGFGDKDKELMTKRNIQTLIAKEFIAVNDDYSVSWIDNENHLDKYDMIKSLADRKLLYIIRESLLLWSFPIEVFREGIFNEIYILTYRFDSQIQAAYYRYFNIPYNKYRAFMSEGEYVIEEYGDGEHDKEFREQIKSKITILENDKLNKVGNLYIDSRNKKQYTSLSKTWYTKYRDTALPILSGHMNNFFSNITKSKSGDRMWTCFSPHKRIFKSTYIHPKNWVALNSRATNKYGHKTALAYMINRYLNPFYDAFFSIRGTTINQDEFALTELVQWIFRSAVRNNEEITLYIPSWRMRSLLKAYLNNEPLDSIYNDTTKRSRRLTDEQTI